MKRLIGRLRCWIIRNRWHPIYSCDESCFYECKHWFNAEMKRSKKR